VGKDSLTPFSSAIRAVFPKFNSGGSVCLKIEKQGIKSRSLARRRAPANPRGVAGESVARRLPVEHHHLIIFDLTAQITVSPKRGKSLD